MMCAICGCSDSDRIVITDMATGRHVHLRDTDGPDSAQLEGWHSHAGDDLRRQDHHEHSHEHSHEHPRHDPHPHSRALTETAPTGSAPVRTIRLETELLEKNNRRAERNRGWFEGRGVLAVNLMSSPGAGKTTLLERTIETLGKELRVHVIEGDQETLRDAERIRALGTPVIQINTGAACHLDAEMVFVAVRQLDPPPQSTLLIENVGNLVCPALFDLGERVRVVIASVPEGDDKPSKYPHMFRSADLVLLNKIDLLPHVAFDFEAFADRVRRLNPKAAILRISAARGDGLDEWHDCLRRLGTEPIA